MSDGKPAGSGEGTPRDAGGSALRGGGEGAPGPAPGSFEESLARLEAIVRELSRGEVPLERSLQAFEEGSALVKACLEKLAAAEESVQRLLARADGGFETAPMDEPANDAEDAGAR